MLTRDLLHTNVSQVSLDCKKTLNLQTLQPSAALQLFLCGIWRYAKN